MMKKFASTIVLQSLVISTSVFGQILSPVIPEQRSIIQRDSPRSSSIPSSCQVLTTLFNDPSTADTQNLYNSTLSWQLIQLQANMSDNGTIFRSWFADGAPFNTSARLVSKPVQLPNDTRVSVFLSFWHKYEMERGYDGCSVYYTTDNGNSWHDMGSHLIQHPYNFEVFSQRGATPAFTGTSNTFNQTIADLSSLKGKTLSFAFVATTDFSVPSVGWWVTRIKMWSALCTHTQPASPTQTSHPDSIPLPTQSESSQGSNNQNNNNYNHKDSIATGVATAALIIAIFTATFVVVVAVVGCCYYYSRKKQEAEKKKPVPMVSIVTQDSAAAPPPSPRS